MKKQTLVAVGLVVILLSFWIGVQQGFSWEGAISSWTPGYFEEARINATTEFYRAGTNYTAWIDNTYLSDDGSETLGGSLTTDGINVDWIDIGGANRTGWPSGSPGEYDYLIRRIGASYYYFDNTGSNVSSSTFEEVTNWAIGNVTTRGIIYVAAGSYSVTGVSTVIDNIKLCGAGASSTILELDYDGEVFNTSDGINDFYIGGFRIDGNRGVRSAGTGLNITGGYRGHVENFYFHDLVNYSIYTGDDLGGDHTRQTHYNNIRMINSGISGGGWYHEYPIDSKFVNIETGYTVDAAYCWRQMNGGSGVMVTNAHFWASTAGTTTGFRSESDSFRTQVNNLYGGGSNMDHLVSSAGHSFLFYGIIGEDCSDTMLEIIGDNNAVYDIRLTSSNADSVVWTGKYGVLSGGQILDSTGDAVQWSDSYGLISSLVINNPGDDGLEITANYVTANDIVIYSAADNGVYAVGDYFSLSGFTIGFSTDYGILYSGVTGGIINDGRVFESVNNDGISVSGSPWTRVSDCTSFNNDAANMRGVKFTGASVNCSAIGLTLYGNGDYNLIINADADDGIRDSNRMDSYGMTGNVLDQSGGTWTTGDEENT